MIIVVTLVVGEAVRILNELIFVSYIRLAKQGSYLALMLVISIFPYFITKRKQLLVDLLVGIVALKDTEYCAVKEKLASYDVQAEENKD